MVDEIKLLKVVQSGGSEASFHGVCWYPVDAGVDVETTAGSPVGGKDAGDDVGADFIPAGGELTAVEIKRGGEPEVAPPGREDSGAGAFLGGEEGDDVAEHGVGEGADVVGASSVFLHTGRGRSPPLRARTPRIHLHEAHGGLGFASVETRGGQCWGRRSAWGLQACG